MLHTLKKDHPKLWKQLKEIAEKHDMQVSEFNSSASKTDGVIQYRIALGERGYESQGYIFASVVKNNNYSDKDYETRETVCFEQNGKLNEEQLEKISNLLEGKQNG